MRTVVVAAAAVIASGCFSPSFRDCELQCSAAGACPDGFFCSAGVCRADGMTGACSAPPVDVLPDEDATDASPLGPWSAPELVPGFSGCSDPAVRPDELEIFVECGGDLLYSTRSTTNAPWSPPTFIPGWFRAGSNTGTFLTFDARTLYFSSQRNGLSSFDIYRYTRAQIGETWEGPTREDDLSTEAGADTGGTTNLAQTEIIINSDRLGGQRTQLFSSTRASTTSPWSSPARIAELNDEMFATNHPAMSGDGLTIVFGSTRGGTGLDLYMSTRASPTSPWETPVPLTTVNAPNVNDSEAWLSPNARVLYFISTRTSPNGELYRSTR